MGQIVPDAVERYLAGLNRAGDEVLDAMAADGAAQNLPLVDAEVGALLRVLALSIGAKRILEIGTAIGYSGIWLAGALPKGGMLLTMEKDPERAAHRARKFRPRRSDRPRRHHRRRRAGDDHESRRAVRPDFSGWPQAAVRGAARSPRGAAQARRAAGDGQRVVGRRGRARVRRSRRRKTTRTRARSRNTTAAERPP